MKITRNKDTVTVIFDRTYPLEFNCGFVADFDFRRLNNDNLARMLLHGPYQVIGDSASSIKNDPDRRAARKKMTDRIHANEWREGGGGAELPPLVKRMRELVTAAVVTAGVFANKSKAEPVVAKNMAAVITQLALHEVAATAGVATDHAVNAYKDQVLAHAKDLAADFESTAAAQVAAEAKAAADLAAKAAARLAKLMPKAAE